MSAVVFGSSGSPACPHDGHVFGLEGSLLLWNWKVKKTIGDVGDFCT